MPISWLSRENSISNFNWATLSRFSSMRFAAWEPDWLILTDTPSLISLGPPVPASLFVCLFVETLVLILFACFV